MDGFLHEIWTEESYPWLRIMSLDSRNSSLSGAELINAEMTYFCIIVSYRDSEFEIFPENKITTFLTL